MTCRPHNLGSKIGFWACQISEETFETYGMLPSAAERKEEDRHHEMLCDLHHEQELADQFVEGLDNCPDWPFYAESPYEVEEPQVFGP